MIHLSIWFDLIWLDSFHLSICFKLYHTISIQIVTSPYMKKIKIICDLNQISMLRLILLLPSITIIVSSSRIVILLISVLIIRFASFTDLIRFVPSNSSIRMILYLSIRFVPSISFRIILPFISSIRIILYNISILFVRFSYSLRHMIIIS